jgi:stearoyl-CoA desaturase (Delta-9 desaturase)
MVIYKITNPLKWSLRMHSASRIVERRFDVSSSIVYLFLHLGCLLALFVEFSGRAVLICVISYLVRIFAISAGYHRYFAHRSYQTGRAFQCCLAVLGTLSLQRGPLWWASTHRAHHLYADTSNDLHSPAHQGFIYSHSLWFLEQRNLETNAGRVADLAIFPELVLLDDKRVYLWQGLTGLAWGFFISTILTHHATHWVQSMSHAAGGYRRFATPDRSRNHWVTAVLSLGEFHNNHHYSPGSARQGSVWWEFDFSYYLLLLLERVGLVWSVRDAFRADRGTDGSIP